MKNAAAIKKLSKFAEVVNTDRSNYAAVIGTKVIEWFADGDGEVQCLKVRGRNDHDDLQSDYHAGYFCKSLDEAIRAGLNSKHKRAGVENIGGKNLSVWVEVRYVGRSFKQIAVLQLTGWKENEASKRRTDGVKLHDYVNKIVESTEPEAIAMAMGVIEGIGDGGAMADKIVELRPDAQECLDMAGF